jgi:hypothetical protein
MQMPRHVPSLPPFCKAGKPACRLGIAHEHCMLAGCSVVYRRHLSDDADLARPPGDTTPLAVLRTVPVAWFILRPAKYGPQHQLPTQVSYRAWVGGRGGMYWNIGEDSAPRCPGPAGLLAESAGVLHAMMAGLLSVVDGWKSGYCCRSASTSMPGVLMCSAHENPFDLFLSLLPRPLCAPRRRLPCPWPWTARCPTTWSRRRPMRSACG